jgi:hydroxymethylbilane synthase
MAGERSEQASMAERLRIGTRGSGLAVAQTGWVAERLRALGHEVTIETISTRGDERGDVPLHTLGGDGVFIRELERALREGRIDLAVHSLKDLPTAASAGLAIGCVPVRASPFDAFVGRDGESFATLPAGAIVGTSSIRRVVQVRAIRPDLEVRPIRGNVDTRLRKLDAGEYRCLVLAAAGLERLGLGHRITGLLSPPEFWPAVGQGALALQIREGDDVVQAAVAPLDHAASRAAVEAERACLAELSAGCLAPVGACGRVDDQGRLGLAARVLEERDGLVRHLTAEAGVDQVYQCGDGQNTPAGAGENLAAALGRRVAESLLASGAGPMLERMRQSFA